MILFRMSGLSTSLNLRCAIAVVLVCLTLVPRASTPLHRTKSSFRMICVLLRSTWLLSWVRRLPVPPMRWGINLVSNPNVTRSAVDISTASPLTLISQSTAFERR
ncbi:hypothetical protein HYPSUDRAFT_433147 [Hypholoma sublateritium FD-334 SS-4]|uniref:Uncharacterized protein n=1 Tax=Hypholoma sublateritium (strain FD-334 SS-4) TaxID=945553 RepID=A0A0D2MM49_HYPSF|nr:hypothetical protein HYPSUDRAFT_433147 [Hypholoma sublateritium FD-334 SS-4]